jgi:hypothetical protein
MIDAPPIEKLEVSEKASRANDAHTHGYRETQRTSLVYVQSAKVLTGIDRQARRKNEFPEGELIAVLRWQHSAHRYEDQYSQYFKQDFLRGRGVVPWLTARNS